MLVRTLAAVSVAALALPQAPAHALAPRVAFSAGGGGTVLYVVSEITIYQGDTLTLVNLDPQQAHDIVSEDFLNGTRVFRSEAVPAGTPSDVKGVSTLPPSSYPFLCSLHPEMRGNLHVEPAPAV
jgi:plastocyanin